MWPAGFARKQQKWLAGLLWAYQSTQQWWWDTSLASLVRIILIFTCNKDLRRVSAAIELRDIQQS
jgi:hypothetical protein